MRILLDGGTFVTHSRGGISRYFVNLAAGLNRKEDCTARILAPAHINAHLSATGGHLSRGLYFPTRRGVGRACRIATRMLSPICAHFIKHDVVHETYYSQTPFVASRAARVTTIHDMIPELFGLDRDLISAKKSSIERCTHIICVSDNTRNDLCEFFDIEPSRTSTVYHGFHDFSRHDTTATEHLFKGEPFFLYVGHRAGYKNFSLLLKAYAAQAVVMRETRIICFGGEALTTREVELIRELGLPSHKIQFVTGGDDLLAAAYRNAIALVYPSLYEGFGLPPLEAMSVGCPVLCSKTSSLPEVVGAAAVTFDPSNYEAIGEAILRIWSSTQMRQELAIAGYRQRNKFSWERCCHETLKIYRQIV